MFLQPLDFVHLLAVLPQRRTPCCEQLSVYKTGTVTAAVVTDMNIKRIVLNCDTADCVIMRNVRLSD
jgi:hypothetical protein